MQYDGTSWSIVSPLSAMGLYAVHAWSADYVLAFGQGSIVLAFDGDEWTQASYPGFGTYYTVAVLPSTAREGRRLQQSVGGGGTDFVPRADLTPAGSTCTDGQTAVVEISDPAYIGPGGDGFEELPICPSSGANLLRCKANDGTVVCDQNVNYEACQWKASGSAVISASGKCPNSGPYCGVFSGDRLRYNALAGISADGTPYKLDASQSRVLQTSDTQAFMCARSEDQKEWPGEAS